MCVDLTWTYSNRLDIADLLRRVRRWVSEDRVASLQDPQVGARAKSNPNVPRRVVDRLGEEVVRQMIEARQVGMKLKGLAEQHGISETGVKRILRCRD